MGTLGDRPRVVVVEDDVDVAELVREILDDEGFDTLTADHRTPVERVAQHQPSLLLMDLMLGGRAGHDVLADLRRAGLAQVPLVLLSGKEGLELEMRTLGAAAAVAKPFEIDVLVGTCRSLLASSAR